MKSITRLKLIFLLASGGLVPWHSSDAEDGTVTGDTRYKFSQSDKVRSESAKVVRTVNTRKTRRVAASRWHSGAHWYYLHAAHIPWWPNAPGD